MKAVLKRALTGTVVVAVILSALCLHPLLYAALFELLVAVALWETYKLLGHRRLLALNILGGLSLFAGTLMLRYVGGDEEIWCLPYILYLLAVFIWGLSVNNAALAVQSWALSFLPQCYVALPLALLNFMVFPAPGVFDARYGVALFAFIWMNDTAAYLCGSAVGKHRMAKRLSPRKTWEGFGGGLLAAMAASQLFALYDNTISGLHWLNLSVVTVVFAVLGDLTESLLKRTAGVKDSGRLLPGHGGLLDRMDSALLAIPAFFIYLRLFIQN